jgi:ribosome biogenesis GTPase
LDGTEREINLPDPIRKLYPGGLVPGDRLRLREGRPVEVSARQTVLINRDADTQAESVVAANPTRLLILMSAKQPDFHGTVLARHLLYAERQGVTPIIALTKADLVGETTAQDWLKPFRTSGYQTVLVSATRGRGIDELKALLKGQVTAVMATAGAGKTTLLGALLGAPAPDAALPHALPLADDTWLIDMPGLRELGVWKPDLSGAFQDFSTYSPGCARPGCLHRQEQGCAVRQAVDQGRLKRRRYEQYLQLLTQMRLA